MRFVFALPLRLVALTLLIGTGAMLPLGAQDQGEAKTQYGNLALRITTMLEEEHFLQRGFDDEMSKRTLEAYLETLDFSRVYFTKEDVEGFVERHELLIDDNVHNEAIPAAFEIYAVYEQRLRDRVKFAQSLAKDGTFTYDSDREVELSRKDAPWASAGEEYDQLWRNLIEGELIRERFVAAAVAKSHEEKVEKAKAEGKEAPPVSAEDKKTPYDKVRERYDRILKRISENTTEDVAGYFIKSIARAYDPHSEFFPPQQYDNFRIGMNKSLIGIGAMLQKDEEFGGATIEGLVVGGPAIKSGNLDVKDRVIGVAQGTDGPFEDVVDKKLSDIVDLIRGELGTIVRLKVVPVGKSTEIKLVDILRDKVDIKESLANADLYITQDPAGNPQKIGWITLPSFYADMDGGNTSTTTDVRRLLTRLTIEGIDGLVIDLRENGGGSLEEAINMTGLFIRKGPVVQSIDSQGRRDQKSSRNGEAVYSGPLVVLNNRASASASEIFAAALQDYGRAVIVGDRTTFGKGTVQQLRPITSGKLVLPFNQQPKDEGALKLTIQTFFRINGHSTQRDGVVSDIHLPSLLDVAEIGETSLPNALTVAPIAASNYRPFFETPLPLDALRAASEARVGSRKGFEYILEDIADESKRIEENVLSLNLTKREAENQADEDAAEARKKERIALYAKLREEEKGLFTIYKLTQDNVLDENLTLRDDLSVEQLSGFRGEAVEKDPEEALLEYPHKMSPYERETVRIIQDLIAIGKTGQPVNISEVTPEPRGATVPISTSGGTTPN